MREESYHIRHLFACVNYCGPRLLRAGRCGKNESFTYNGAGWANVEGTEPGTWRDISERRFCPCLNLGSLYIPELLVIPARVIVHSLF
jgi:hypothetical protein